MASVADSLPHHDHKLFRAAPLDRYASSYGATSFVHRRDLRASFLCDEPRDHRPPLHAHVRDPADPCGGYGMDDLRCNSPPPFPGIDTLGQVSAPALPSPSDLRRTSSRRRRRSFSPHPWPHEPYQRRSPPSRSPHRERYREYHQRARGESSRSRSPSSHSSHRSRLGDSSGGSSSGRHGYEEARGGGRVPYGAECRTAERLGSSRGQHPHGRDKRSSSPLHEPTRKSPVLAMVDKPVVDDGNKSPADWPDSPVFSYCYENHLKMIFGHTGDGNKNSAPGDSDSACGAYDGSEITNRDVDCKYHDRSYDGLVNDFMDAVAENWREPSNYDPAANHELYRKRTKRFAELALKRYNKNKNNKNHGTLSFGHMKVKYSLVEAVDGTVFSEDSYCYAHVNFYAKANNGPNKNGAKLLVFAELHHVGRRLNAMALTSFQFIDETRQFLGRRKMVRSSCTGQDWDIYHCYACSGKIKHPEGSCYKAGHFVGVSYYYED